MAFLYFTRTGGLAYNIRVEAEDEVMIKDDINHDDNDRMMIMIITMVMMMRLTTLKLKQMMR